MLTKEELVFLLKFVDEELEVWAEQDTLEEEAFGEIRGIDQLSQQSRKKVQKMVQHYLKRIKDRGVEEKEEVKRRLESAREELENEGLKKVNVTDPASRFMKNAKGNIELSYNPQVTADSKGFILANDVSQQSFDTWNLQPQVKQTKENLGALPKSLIWSFDSGYYESGNIEFLAENDIDGYIQDHNVGKPDNPFDKKNFRYDEDRDQYICPSGKSVVFLGTCYDRQKGKEIRVYRGKACSCCPQQGKCTKRKDGIRHVKMFPGEKAREALRTKMKTPRGIEIYKLRKQIVEPVLGNIKENIGVRGFLTRGIRTVQAEFNLICTAANIQKIWRNKKEKERRISVFQIA